MDLKKILPTDGPPVEEVLKYVEKYKNEIIVIKYGGNVFIDRETVSYTHLTLPTNDLV